MFKVKKSYENLRVVVLVLISIIVLLLANMIFSKPQTCHVDYAKLDEAINSDIPLIEDNMTIGQAKYVYNAFKTMPSMQWYVDSQVKKIVICEEGLQ